MINKKKIISSVISMLEAFVEEKPEHIKIKEKISKEIMKKKDVAFVLKAFEEKFDLWMNRLDIEPIIKEDLSINGWALSLNGEIVLKGENPQEVLDKASEWVLKKDKELSNFKKKLQALRY